MSTMAAVSQVRFGTKWSADAALKGAARFWFVLVVLGQLVFAFSIASFYISTAARGELSQWNKFMTHGNVAGQPIGNGVVVVHLVGVVLLIVCGALQLVPQVLRRAPKFHRWNGRVYLVSALSLSAAGMYMLWVRGTVGGLGVHMATTTNVVLIWVCAGMALRYALQRDFKRHRAWALRLYVVSLGGWFIRVLFPLWIVVFRGPLGVDLTTLTGPGLLILTYGEYLVPLAAVELYLRAQARPGAARRWAAAVVLFVLTLGMATGTVLATAGSWVPTTKIAFDSRKPISDVLDATIKQSGLAAAVAQYHALKTTAQATYNFDESQLNDFGYVLLRAKKYPEAIGILALNVEAYPKSANVYDSLGEAYMDAGDRAEAIANYRRSVEMNPKSSGGRKMLERLGVR